MARQLVFVLDGVDYPFYIEKVDRDKLYGKVDTIPKDPAGRPLEKGYLDEWGCVVIAQAGMGHLIKQNFEWIENADLVAYDKEGNALEQVASSFDAPIEMEEVPMDVFMDREVTSLYALKAHNLEEFNDLLGQKKGLFQFPFMYRKGYLPSLAYLIPGATGPFMAITQPADLQLLSKPQKAAVDDFGRDDDDDEIDFGMF